MDGATALKFVRSRHAEGDEGTDLARAARQERVISAIKEKALSKDVYLHPKKLMELKDAVLASIETDITPEEGAVLVRWFVEARGNSKSYVLSEDYLEVAPKSSVYDNLYVFIPKEVNTSDPSGRSWIKVHGWIACLLSEKSSCN
jgi:anionic cell wall polymer biosynthesis LytR-Cps2A-Psr (LCP) family protein